MDFMSSLLINLLLTAVIYTAFPLISLVANHGKLEKQRAKKIALWNSIVLGAFFCTLTSLAGDDVSWNAAPAFVYYWINCSILTNKKGGSPPQKDSSVSPEDIEVFNAKLKQKPRRISCFQSLINRKILLRYTLISITTTLIMLLGLFVFIPALKYNYAKKLLDSNHFDLAYSAFMALDGYSDSEDMLLECRYLQAIEYRNTGNYELANTYFRALGHYKDCQALIHNHTYKLNRSVAATCIATGTNYYQCAGCGDIYEEIIPPSSHTPILISSKEATCMNTGLNYYKCTMCNLEYSVEIAQLTHNYSAATCIVPKTCTMCGKTEGAPAEHSKDIAKCLECGTIFFETLTYSGSGNGAYSKIYLPYGAFVITRHITSTYSSSSSFAISLMYPDLSEIVHWDTSLGTYVEDENQLFWGPINGGFMRVSTDPNISWTITIEVAEN